MLTLLGIYTLASVALGVYLEYEVGDRDDPPALRVANALAFAVLWPFFFAVGSGQDR